MWMGGGGPAADGSGNVYVVSGNGFGDTPGANGSYGNSFVRLSTTSTSGLTVADYFTPFNTLSEDGADADFGSAGPLLLPNLTDASGATRHLAVGAGKDGNLYVLDRDNLGQFNSTKNNVYQQFALSSGENHSSPVFFNNTVYVGPTNSSLKAFSVSKALLAPSSQSAHVFGGNGTVASISANGSMQGIVWALDWSAGILFAYDATDLTKELYDTNQAASNRDHFSTVAGHFITPMVANGRVYVGTKSTVAVFGLLH